MSKTNMQTERKPRTMTSSTRSRFSFFAAGFAALAIAGCGTVGAGATAGSQSIQAVEHPVPRRGEVAVRGPSVRVVVAGPVAIHAYSEFPGGSIYSAPAVTRTDKDCQLGAGANAPVLKTVQADRITSYSAREGQVVCLATDIKGSFGLAWHAVEASSRDERTSLQARN
jgi:hypothetical protein